MKRRSILLCLLALPVNAAIPAFDAASVKPSDPNASDPRITFQTNPGGVTIRNERLQFLIPWAFKVPVYQLIGGPDWLNSDKFDIIARAPAGSSDDELRSMVQTLLAERFRLKVHREKKELSAYALVRAKDGPKVKIEERDSQDKDSGRVGAGPGRMMAHMISSSVLAETLSLFLNRPVLDQTGIDGFFNVSLQWTPDATERQPGPLPPDETNSPGSLFTAIQEQLGLRLTSRRAPFEMLVIDHLERPTEN